MVLSASCTCPGCGLDLPASDGPAHPYIGASAACWGLYGELLALEYGPMDMPAVHRLTVDAYAVQHPGVPERRSVGSVAVHLMALGLVFEHDMPTDRVTRAMDGISEGLDLRWLAPPEPNGTLTVYDVLVSDDHEAAVRRWARSVWDAWEPHHATVEEWLALAARRRAL